MAKEDKANCMIDGLLNSLNIQREALSRLDKITRLMPLIKSKSELVKCEPNSPNAITYCEGFLDGYESRINAVWHYDKSTPLLNKPFLFVCHKGAIALQLRSEEDWRLLVKDRIYVKWAYIEDLIPNEEEEI